MRRFCNTLSCLVHAVATHSPQSELIFVAPYGADNGRRGSVPTDGRTGRLNLARSICIRTVLRIYSHCSIPIVSLCTRDNVDPFLPRRHRLCVPSNLRCDPTNCRHLTRHVTTNLTTIYHWGSTIHKRCEIGIRPVFPIHIALKLAFACRWHREKRR